MERVIKFRAWHTEAKEMLYPGKGKQSYVFSWIEEGQPVKLMQLTGLKDKFGKEIYEGDIIIHNKQKYIIKWSDYLCGWIAISCETKIGFRQGEWIKRVSKHITIAGNSYESPELL